MTGISLKQIGLQNSSLLKNWLVASISRSLGLSCLYVCLSLCFQPKKLKKSTQPLLIKLATSQDLGWTSDNFVFKT